MTPYNLSSPIISPSQTTAAQKQSWLESRGQAAAPTFAPDGQYKAPPPDIGQIVDEEANRWQPATNGDVLISLIDLESAGWQSALARNKNNPSGFGAIDGPDSYNSATTFPDARRAIEATNAKLRNYAIGEGDWSPLDTRFDKIPQAWRGTTTRIRDFGHGRYATDPNYAGKLLERMNALLTFASQWESPMDAQIPGFAWHPADSLHYERGRTQRISGGAQHYTAGTNSLGWLTTSSKPPVSAHFLVKHEPTLANRGWQLVRIEDTAWTTAFANPYTVAIEYEHRQTQSIPDVAYEVLAQTWADITRYVRQRNLGDIELIAGHREWVNNSNLICPDGIDVGRIVGRVRELLANVPPSPAIPSSQPDPHGSPYWVLDVFVEEIARYPWIVTGVCLGGAYGMGDMIVQDFERARLEQHADGSVHRGLVNAELLEARAKLRALRSP